MFVCHGNICRSPMAEFIMKDLVRKENLTSQFVIASSATSTEEIGNPVYPPARAELKCHNVYCDDGKYAIQLKKSDYEISDAFLRTIPKTKYTSCLNMQAETTMFLTLGTADGLTQHLRIFTKGVPPC